VEGRVYIAGETPSFQSRMSSIKRQLLNLWLAGGMPDGIDVCLAIKCQQRPKEFCNELGCVGCRVPALHRGLFQCVLLPEAYLPVPAFCHPLTQFVIEAEDGPTVGGTNEECPSRGPLIGAAKVPSDPSHSHVSRLPADRYLVRQSLP
jgi:hypothetical protein